MGQRRDEIRDFPPDFHQYIREALPEDMIPGGELALPSQILGIGGLANGILIRDVVISNTDKNVKNTNRGDQTPDYGRNHRLSATFLDTDRLGIDAYSGTTSDPTSAAAWKWFVENGVAQPTDQVGEGGTDQPWLLVDHDPTTKSQDDVYVAYDKL
jgi:hypothetical protein